MTRIDAKPPIRDADYAIYCTMLPEYTIPATFAQKERRWSGCVNHILSCNSW